MKKVYLLYIAVIFSLLFLNSVKAYNLLNFTGSTPKELYNANEIDQIKTQYFSTNQNFYVGFSFNDGTNKDCRMSKWSNNLEIKDLDFVAYWVTVNSGEICDYFDFTINPSISNLYAYWVAESNYNGQARSGNFTLNTFASQCIYSVCNSGTVNVRGVSISKDLKVIILPQPYIWTPKTIFWSEASVLEKDPTLWVGGNGTLTIPNEVTSINGYNTVKLVYIPITNEYWLFYPDQDNNIWVSRYDNSFSYINSNKITDGEIPSSSDNVNPDYDVIYNTKYGYNVYVAVHLFGNSTIRITTFDVVSTKQANNLVTVIFQDLNLTDNDPLVNTTNNITALSLDYNPNRDHFYLFYAYNTSISGTNLNVLEETFNCQYSIWQNTSECQGSNRKQTRTTNDPLNCNAIIQFINAPDFCIGGQYGNQTEIVYTPITKCGTPCEDTLRDPKVDPVSKCIASIEIPSNCTGNITVKATMSPYTELSSGIAILDPFTYTICSSNTDCITDDDSCITHNKTYSLTNNNYSAGQTATGQFEISDAFNCKTYPLASAWKYYKVTGSICYTCNIPCGFPQCQKVGVKDYAVPYDNLCNPKISCISDDSCYCQYGCLDGVCKISTQAKEEKESEDIATGLGNPIKQVFGWGLTGLDVAFGGSSEMKILGASIITLGFGIGVVSMVKKNALASVLGFLATTLTLSFFFVLKGWYPWWLVVLVDIPVAMFIVFMVTGKKSA